MSNYKNQAYNDLQARIKGKRDEATRLENERGLSAQGAVDNVNRAKQLRSEAAWLEQNTRSHEVQSWLLGRETENQLNDAHEQLRVQADFSAMQNELLGVEDERNGRIEQTMKSLAYNTAVNVPPTTIKRQLGKLLDGQGDTDARGNRFIRFQEGDSPVFRAIVTKDGHYGIVTEAMGSGGESGEG